MINKNLPETITWKAPSHISHQHSRRWYLTFIIIAIGLMAFAIFFERSIMTIVTFALMLAIVFVFANLPAKTITYKLTKTAITAGNVQYPYKIIKFFWLVYNPEVKALNIETSSYLNNKISFQLGDQDPIAVKMFLSQYLLEDLDREERLSDSLARKLKI